MKYIKTFEKIKIYSIYYKRFNDYSDDIMKNINMLDDNNIKYDIYHQINSNNNNHSIMLYIYYNKSDCQILIDNNYNYSPTLTSLYCSTQLYEIRNKISELPSTLNWNHINKDELLETLLIMKLKSQTDKFNL